MNSLFKLSVIYTHFASFTTSFVSVVFRSRDRSLLVRRPRGETHWALWEAAQQRGGSGQRGDAARRQDFGAPAQQPQK